MSIEDELLDKALSINYDDLPSEVVMAGKKSVVDLIGVAIAGSTTPVAKKLFEVVSQWQGKPEASKLSLRLSLNVAEISTRDGKSYGQKMLHARGSPEKPMTFEECTGKARRCAQFTGFSAEKMDKLTELINNLEQLEDINVITELLK